MRKTSQAALLVLLEQGLLSKVDMETKVCPVLLELTEPSSDDDYKIEAVAVRYLPFLKFNKGGLLCSVRVKSSRYVIDVVLLTSTGFTLLHLLAPKDCMSITST